jgi:hypothetical protein
MAFLHKRVAGCRRCRPDADVLRGVAMLREDSTTIRARDISRLAVHRHAEQVFNFPDKQRLRGATAAIRALNGDWKSSPRPEVERETSIASTNAAVLPGPRSASRKSSRCDLASPSMTADGSAPKDAGEN